MDTDRHEERAPFSRIYDAEDDNFARGFADEDFHPGDEFGCLFPGSCCMPELHFVSECHTAEMAEEMHEYSALAEARECRRKPPRAGSAAGPGRPARRRDPVLIGVAPVCPKEHGLKDYGVRRVGPDGRREIVADTTLLSEARAFPALLDGAASSVGLRRESVETATGRVVYPDARPGRCHPAHQPEHEEVHGE